MKKLNNKGFTLMEMLIVVAIIAILIAVAIPTMTSALEKSRESADAANIRSCYAQVMTFALTDAAEGDEKLDENKNAGFNILIEGEDEDKTITGAIELTQKQDMWQNKSITEICGEDNQDSTNPLYKVGSGKWVSIVYDNGNGTVKFDVVDDDPTES